MPKPTTKKKPLPTRAISEEARKRARKEAAQQKNRSSAKAQRERRPPEKKGEGNRFTNPDGSPKKRPKTPEDRKFKDVAICGATRSKNYAEDPDNPGQCTLTAGWGTDHLGYGKCRYHGGNIENMKKAAEKERLAVERLELEKRMIETYGLEVEVDPHAALAHEVRRTAGHVAWLNAKIRESDDHELFQLTPSGKTASALLQVYQQERDRLVSVSKAAISAGVAERAITLAEEQGKLIAMVIRNILFDPTLELTPQQRHLSGGVVRKHLMALDQNVIDVQEVELTETG